MFIRDTSPGTIAARAREGLNQKFLQQVDPLDELPDDERQKRAESARLAHLARARKAHHDRLQRRQQQRLEVAQRIYNEARRRAGLAPLAEDGGRCG